MKTRKLMTIALCAVACTVASAIAEEKGDDLIASATPTAAIADPVNPKPGMVFKGYNVGDARDTFELAFKLEKCPTVKMTVAKSEKFSFDEFGRDVHIRQGVWEGFIKCKRSANCTILLQQGRTGFGNSPGYALFINGKKFINGYDQSTGTIDLKAGFNHIKLVVQQMPVSISLKATGSTREPKPLTPKDMFYDDKPDEGDVF